MAGTKRTLAEDLRALVSEEGVADVVLRGKDRTVTPAIRVILAARSDVFKKMFFGNFSESKSEEVSLDYSGVTLRSLVHYCYTDELKMLSNESSASDEEEGQVEERELVRLVSASHYFDIPGLQTAAEDSICSLMKDNPSASCAVLDQLLKEEMVEHKLVDMAMLVVQCNPEKALLPKDSSNGGVYCMDIDALSKMMESDDIVESPIIRFKAVKRWNDGVDTGKKRKKKKRRADSRSDTRRQKVAKDIVSSIDLGKILPSQLVTDVEPSGLVSSEQLAEAFKTQALQAETNGSVSGGNPMSKAQSSDVIIVAGAGISEVNGIYYRTPMDGLEDIFIKEGTWNGEEVSYRIVRDDDDNEDDYDENKNWWIWIKDPPGETPNSHVDLYQVNADPDDESAVTSGTWNVCDDTSNHCHRGVAPGPICIAFSNGVKDP